MNKTAVAVLIGVGLVVQGCGITYKEAQKGPYGTPAGEVPITLYIVGAKESCDRAEQQYASLKGTGAREIPQLPWLAEAGSALRKIFSIKCLQCNTEIDSPVSDGAKIAEKKRELCSIVVKPRTGEGQ